MTYAARAFVVFAFVITVVFALVTFGGYQVIIQSRAQAQFNGRQAEFNGSILKILLSVSGCTLADTPQTCTDRQAARAKDQGDGRVDAVTCRVRLAIAGLPVPAAAEPCEAPR